MERCGDCFSGWAWVCGRGGLRWEDKLASGPGLRKRSSSEGGPWRAVKAKACPPRSASASEWIPKPGACRRPPCAACCRQERLADTVIRRRSLVSALARRPLPLPRPEAVGGCPPTASYSQKHWHLTSGSLLYSRHQVRGLTSLRNMPPARELVLVSGLRPASKGGPTPTREFYSSHTTLEASGGDAGGSCALCTATRLWTPPCSCSISVCAALLAMASVRASTSWATCAHAHARHASTVSRRFKARPPCSSQQALGDRRSRLANLALINVCSFGFRHVATPAVPQAVLKTSTASLSPSFLHGRRDEKMPLVATSSIPSKHG